MSSALTAETLECFPAERMKQAFAWMDEGEVVSKAVALAKDASLWLAHFDILREQEEDLMLAGKYEKALGEHRVIVCAMIAEGERIILKAKRAGITEFPSGFSVSDFEAALDSARLTFRCQHAQENTPAVSAMIDKLLNGS
jgi:hypothetical protein